MIVNLSLQIHIYIYIRVYIYVCIYDNQTNKFIDVCVCEVVERCGVVVEYSKTLIQIIAYVNANKQRINKATTTCSRGKGGLYY